LHLEGQLTDDERQVRDTVREWIEREAIPAVVPAFNDAVFPTPLTAGMADLGIFGAHIDGYGCAGLGPIAYGLIMQELERADSGLRSFASVQSSLAMTTIHDFGSEAQRERYLPAMAAGTLIGAFALTEAGAGSDAAAMTTSVTRANGRLLLNGAKLFTTNAEEADTFVVLATRDRGLRTSGIEALVVERGTEGFTINPQHGKMGMRATSTAELVFEDCAVPEENRLGGEGDGWHETMEVLNTSRIAIGAQCVGIAQAAHEAAVQYARQREAFGKHLADFQGIQWTIADMATDIEAARLLVRQAATLKDQGLPFVTEASMAKMYASRVATDVTNKAVQIHGGTGYFAPTPVERYFRDARVTEIYEGTTEIQRTIIARNVLGL
jgi:alkylation response protein AidB-like acyl-CoA dehydrogenase